MIPCPPGALAKLAGGLDDQPLCRYLVSQIDTSFVAYESDTPAITPIEKEEWHEFWR